MAKTKKKAGKIILTVVIILIVAAILLFVVLSSKNKANAVSYEEATATRTTITQYVLGSGNAKPCDVKSVFATKNGTVTSMRKAEGDYVVKGETILYVAGNGYTAPISGTITKMSVEEEQQVTPNTTLFTVTDYRNFDITTSINETMLYKLSVGADAVITFNALPDESFKATITEIARDGTISGSSTLFSVTLALDMSNPNASYIKNNMTCEVKMISKVSENVLAVPVKAVKYDGTTPFVTVLENGEYVMRELSLGVSDGTTVEVLSGLSDGEKIFYTTNTTSIFEQMMGGFGR